MQTDNALVPKGTKKQKPEYWNKESQNEDINVNAQQL